MVMDPAVYLWKITIPTNLQAGAWSMAATPSKQSLI